MGYAPSFPLAPEGPYGTEAAQELMKQSGLTTDTERPLLETGTGVAAPFAGYAGLKAGKALAPTAMEMLDVELANMMKPYQMSVAPEGKAGKLKAPANPVGFYNPAEKAALNLQRKKGPGSAFISDMKKQPGVTDERIAELGLTDLASNPNLTREEVIAAAEQNRIPLRESVRRPYQEADEYSETADALKEGIRYREGGIQQVQAELDRVREMSPTSPLVQQYENKIETMRQSIARDRERLEGKKPSLYGPDSHPDYNMPGGENYREIRVGLPSNKRQMSYEDWRKSGSSEEWSSDGTVGGDFMHQTHHGDEPNVLFHLRVADHTDVEGKKGLLIDELQSDWHQAGREYGYKNNFTAQERKRLIDLSVRNSRPYEPPLNASELEELQKLTEKDRQNFRGVYNAPFKDNWYQLGLKRAIKEAADTGMDRVYLTTGARQADRYDLSKHVSRVEFQESYGGQEGVLYAFDKDGAQVMAERIPASDIDKHIGKDAAKKLMATKDKRLSGVDLKIGGEGMKQYYDKTYKNYLDKYAKQFGGRIGETRLPNASLTRDKLSADEIKNFNENPEFKKIYDEEYSNVIAKNEGIEYVERWNVERAWNAAMKRFAGEPVYYIDITPKMIESAKKGQSYAFGGGVFNTDPDITDSGRIIPEHTI
jgi:hypothetical protein